MITRSPAKSPSGTLARLLVSVVIASAAAGSAQAQGSPDNSGNPAILTAVKGVENDVKLVQSSVDKLSGLSFATALFTPMLQVSGPEDFAACSIVNVSAASQLVHVELLSFQGTPLGADTLSLSAGEGLLTIADASNQVGTRLVYCKFALLSGSKADFRASLYMASPGGTPKVAVPAE